MRFQKGESGNPTGRPRGVLNYATLLAQELLAARVESIAGKLIELAEGGDMRAIRVCMDRLVPAIKDQPIAVELPPIEKPADSVAAAAAIAAAVAAGELTAAEAARLAKVVDVYVRALDSKGFDERLGKLEKEIRGAPAVPAHAAKSRHELLRPAHAAPRKVADRTDENRRTPTPHACAVGR